MSAVGEDPIKSRLKIVHRRVVLVTSALFTRLFQLEHRAAKQISKSRLALSTGQVGCDPSKTRFVAASFISSRFNRENVRFVHVGVSLEPVTEQLPVG